MGLDENGRHVFAVVPMPNADDRSLLRDHDKPVRLHDDDHDFGPGVFWVVRLLVVARVVVVVSHVERLQSVGRVVRVRSTVLQREHVRPGDCALCVAYFNHNYNERPVLELLHVDHDDDQYDQHDGRLRCCLRVEVFDGRRGLL